MTELIQFVNDQLVLVGTFVMLLGLLIFNIIGEKFKKYTDISVNEMINLMDDKKTTIIDVRELKERTGGFIANGVHIPLAQVKGKLNTLKPENNIIIYCRSGSRSAHACRQLTKANFENVYNLKGGFLAWLKASMPIKTK